MSTETTIKGENMQERLTIDGIEYVRNDTLPAPADSDYVLVRSSDAGVFVGILESQHADSVVLSNARRIWYWAGAATLSELAVKGTSKPSECKFPASVQTITVLGVCEIIPMTDVAVQSVAAVPVWSEQ